MIEFNDVPSPFCGIGTDDLSIQVDGLSLKVLTNGCSVNTSLFEHPITDTEARVKGQPVCLEDAIAAAAALLRSSQQALFGGCATDVNGMRALLSLADNTGAFLENLNFAGARNNFLALQDSGWMNTTLAEVKNRCDVLLIIGTDLEQFAPRFFERYLWTDAMFLPDSSQRQIIYLGKAPSGQAATSPTGKAPRIIDCAPEDLPEVLAVLRALVKKQPIRAEQVANLAIADLSTLAEQLSTAKYGVVTWLAGAFDKAHGELSVQMLSEMIKDLNANTRCSGLPLSGKEGDQTANQVCGWTTGYPARLSFNQGYPEYDPFLYDSTQLLANNEVDTLVWVHAFNATALPPVTKLPTLVIGRSGMQFDTEPEVYIPVGTPGIDHTGHAYRMDNVVAIRLKKLRDSGLPSTADVLHRIQLAL